MICTNAVTMHGNRQRACVAQELPDALRRFPGTHQGQQAGHDEGEGADMVVGELADTLRHMRTEAALLRYLSALRALQGSPFLGHTRRITRIRLQVRHAAACAWH